MSRCPARHNHPIDVGCVVAKAPQWNCPEMGSSSIINLCLLNLWCSILKQTQAGSNSFNVTTCNDPLWHMKTFTACTAFSQPDHTPGKRTAKSKVLSLTSRQRHTHTFPIISLCLLGVCRRGQRAPKGALCDGSLVNTTSATLEKRLCRWG